MKPLAILTLVVAGLLASVAAAPALNQGKAFLWNGTHWTQVSEEGKAAYIFGIGNLADFEAGAAGARRTPCVSRVFVDELKGKTVLQIVQEVDKYYRENPGKLSTPVIEVVLRQCTKACPPEAGGAPKN